MTSTLGAGTAVASFDPFLNFKGFTDHTVAQEGNAFSYGVLTFKQNTIEALANYTQNFPLGTGLTVNYEGQRYANNSPYEAINPSLYSNFQVVLTQQLLAGFGISTNERYMHIAKKNLQITDLAFRAQVIATITQVENIYWDLVNAYQDEQVKERSLVICTANTSRSTRSSSNCRPFQPCRSTRTRRTWRPAKATSPFRAPLCV